MAIIGHQGIPSFSRLRVTSVPLPGHSGRADQRSALLRKIQRDLRAVATRRAGWESSWRSSMINLEGPPRLPKTVEVLKRFLKRPPRDKAEESLKEKAGEGLIRLTAGKPEEAPILSASHFWGFVVENWPVVPIGNVYSTVFLASWPDRGKGVLAYREHAEKVFEIAHDPARPLPLRQRALLAIWRLPDRSERDRLASVPRGELDEVTKRVFKLADKDPDLFWPVLYRGGSKYAVRKPILKALVREAERTGERRLSEEAEEALVNVLISSVRAWSPKGRRRPSAIFQKIRDLIHSDPMREPLFRVLERSNDLQGNFFLKVAYELGAQGRLAGEIIRIALEETARLAKGEESRYDCLVFHALTAISLPEARQALKAELDEFLKLFPHRRRANYGDLYRLHIVLEALREKGLRKMDDASTRMILDVAKKASDPTRNDVAHAAHDIFEEAYKFNPRETKRIWEEFTGFPWNHPYAYREKERILEPLLDR